MIDGILKITRKILSLSQITSTELRILLVGQQKSE
nr:MAG TPA: hypothetical protein [Caudoviricetes sp.]